MVFVVDGTTISPWNMPSILEELSSANPTLDQENSKRGANTTNSNWSPLTGLIEWDEFNYDTLISCYGDILKHSFPPFPDVQPPLTELEREIWDEDSFEHFLSRAIVPQVNLALKRAWSFCVKNWNFARPAVLVQMGRGGLATKTQESDSRFRPDWAGLSKDRKTDSG